MELPLPRLSTLSTAANRERSSDDIHIVGRVRAPASSAMLAPSPRRRRDLSRRERYSQDTMRTKPPTDPTILDRARRMRREMTEAELKLWSIVRNRSLIGAKFRRQVPIRNYIADFCCLAHRLIVQVDGGPPAEQEAADSSTSRLLD